jgi:hypothetical protein
MDDKLIANLAKIGPEQVVLEAVVAAGVAGVLALPLGGEFGFWFVLAGLAAIARLLWTGRPLLGRR